jgi:hypothetical protein
MKMRIERREMLVARIEAQREVIEQQLSLAAASHRQLTASRFSKVLEVAGSGSGSVAALATELQQLDRMAAQIKADAEVVRSIDALTGHVAQQTCSSVFQKTFGTNLSPGTGPGTAPGEIEALQRTVSALQKENRDLRRAAADSASALDAMRLVKANAVEESALRRMAAEFNARATAQLRAVGKLFGWRIDAATECPDGEGGYTISASVGGVGPRRSYRVRCPSDESAGGRLHHEDLAGPVEMYKEFQQHYTAVMKARREEEMSAQSTAAPAAPPAVVQEVEGTAAATSFSSTAVAVTPSVSRTEDRTADETAQDGDPEVATASMSPVSHFEDGDEAADDVQSDDPPGHRKRCREDDDPPVIPGGGEINECAVSVSPAEPAQPPTSVETTEEFFDDNLFA